MGAIVHMKDVRDEIWRDTIAPALMRSMSETRISDADVPRQLLHFTSAAALIHILRTGKLRLSRAMSSNDPKELAFGIGLAKDEARAVLAGGSKWDDLLGQALFASFAGRFADGSPHALPDPHVCCFTQPECEAGVEHWALYGREGAGFVLVFDGPSLAANKSADLIRVRYDIEAQKAQMRKFVATARETCEAARSQAERSGAVYAIDKAHSYAAHAFGAVARVHAASMKREIFQFEKEWRLMVSWIPVTIPKLESPLQWGIEAVGPILRTHYELPFDPLSLKAIVVGPAHAGLNKPVVEALLEAHDEYKDVEVRVGTVELRSFRP